MSHPSRLSLSPDLSSDEENYSATRNGRNKGKEPSSDNDDAPNSSQDYAAHMDEIFSDEDEKEAIHDIDARANSDDSDDDEGFIYTGVDAEPSVVGYQAQLADVLDGEKLSSEGGSDEEHSAPENGNVTLPPEDEVHFQTSTSESQLVSVKYISSFRCD